MMEVMREMGDAVRRSLFIVLTLLVLATAAANGQLT